MVAYGNTPRGPVEADDHNHDKDEAPVTPNLTPCSSREATPCQLEILLISEIIDTKRQRAGTSPSADFAAEWIGQDL